MPKTTSSSRKPNQTLTVIMTIVLIVGVLAIFAFFYAAYAQNQTLQTSSIMTTSATESLSSAEQEALDNLSVNAANAGPNYIATYRGTLPCADCAGIDTTLLLVANDPTTGYTGTYQMVRIYDDATTTQPASETGIFIKTIGTDLDPNAPVYQLRDSLGYATWNFKEVPQALEKLNIDGSEYTGNLPKTLYLIDEGSAYSP